MMTTSTASGTGEAIKLGQLVRVKGELATVFEISVLGLATVKYLSTGRKEHGVLPSELQTARAS